MNHSPAQVGFFQSELGRRVLSAVVLLVFTLFLSWLGGIPFTLMCAALSFVLFYEWQAIVRTTPFDGTEALLTGGFITLLFCSMFGLTVYGVVAYALLGLVLEFSSSGKEKADVRWIGLGGLYCAIPVIALPIIRQDGGLSLLMFLFLIVWATDIAAYFAGRRFGGPKLLPAVSPKKTWSGALGGLAGTGLVALMFMAWVPGYDNWPILIIAFLLSVSSQIGDLFESWVKRKFGVKDSGQLIPGHGGFLDRVDGLVAAALLLLILIAFNPL